MRIFYKNILIVTILLFSILIHGCNSNSPTEPSTDAQLLEFNIKELPNTIFSVDHDNGLVTVTNPQTISEKIDLTSMTASFSVSKGATIYINETEQQDETTVNDFAEGVFYTIVSEDESQQKTYFVYLTAQLPLNYILAENTEPEVLVNPSELNPLTAQINFETRTESSIEIEILGDQPLQHSFSGTSTIHSIPVLGLYADTDNQVVLKVTNGQGHSAIDTLTITTDALPNFLPTPEIDVLDKEAMEPGMHFSEVHIGNAGTFDSYPLIFDDNGDIRWVMDFSYFKNINWPVQFNDDNTFFVAHGQRVHEYNMLGIRQNIIEEAGDNNIHHEVIKLPNGNYVSAVSKIGTTMIKEEEEIMSVEDYIIEMSPSGEILTEWDIAKILDVNRIDLIDGDNDWFHMNAIWYDEEDESLIISGRNQGVIKVNWKNELQWILAPHKGWGKAGRYEKTTETAPYLLTAIDQSGTPFSDDVQQGLLEHSNFSWTWGQHAPMILPNGNLFIFDNGFNRNFGASGSYSLATEYEIDEENMTVTEAWSYGRNRGDELFSNIISDVDYLPETQNRLFAPGIIRTGDQPHSKIVEITYPGKNVVFESSLYYKNELVNGQGWGNLDISYRAERVSLYR